GKQHASAAGEGSPRSCGAWARHAATTADDKPTIAAANAALRRKESTEMSAIQRSSNVVWEGTIASGAGRLSAHSGSFTAFARLPPGSPKREATVPRVRPGE